MHGFEQAGCTLAAADAHGDNTVLRARPASHFIRECPCHTRAGHSERMPDRDRSAVHVQLFHRNAQPVATVDHLHGKGFVQLPQVNVANLKPVSVKQSWARQTPGRYPSRPARNPPRQSHGRSAYTECRVDRRARATSAEWRKRHPIAGKSFPRSRDPRPLAGSKTGFSASSPSSVVSGRLHSSRSQPLPGCPMCFACFPVQQRHVTPIGAISSSKKPSSCARAVRCWLTSEYSSCACRLIL